MNSVSINARVFVAPKPIDFRKRMDGTAASCRELFNRCPLDGGMFLFVNRSRTMIRCYYFDGHGECLLEKRAAEGKFPWWSGGGVPDHLEPTLANLLLRGADPEQARLPAPWKDLT